MNRLPETILAVAPVGDFKSGLLDAVCREISRVFDYPARLFPLHGGVDFAYDPVRQQYHSTPILDRLAAGAPAGAVKVLGITRVDLFIPILTHVYGEAQLGGRAALVSIFRLGSGLPAMDPEKVFYQRVVKEAIHELGHTFSLRHCPDPTCIMHYCRSERDVDRKSDELCRYCRTLTADEIRRLGGAGPSGG